MNVDKTKIELFRMIDAMPASMIEDLYNKLKESGTVVAEPIVEWQRQDIEQGIKDLNEGRKMDFDDFISTL
jgi:protoporphyrinogen oxidase